MKKTIVLSKISSFCSSYIKQIAIVSLLGLILFSAPISSNAQSIIVEKIPAEYDTIQVRKILTPAHIKLHEIPAEYQTITSRRIVRKGPCFPEWKELSCTSIEESKIPVAKMQLKLKERGYYEGEIHNVLNQETKNAVINFRRAYKLTPVFEVDNYLLAALGIAD